MSEFYLNPLPTEKEYDAFFIQHDDLIVNSGGALSALRAYEYEAVHGTQSSFDHIHSTGIVALELEPKDIDGKCFDPLMLATHAFKRGMLLGFDATSLLYDNLVTPDRIKESIKTGFRHESLSGQRGEQLEEIPLLQGAGKGLSFMGEASRRVIRLWAEDITDDPTLQRLFGYGVGAVSYTGEALATHQGMYAIEAHFKRPDWSRELEQILASNTGE